MLVGAWAGRARLTRRKRSSAGATDYGWPAFDELTTQVCPGGPRSSVPSATARTTAESRVASTVRPSLSACDASTTRTSLAQSSASAT
jgi:hypothetical protein